MFPEHADCLYRDAGQMERYILELEARGWPLDDQFDDVIQSWRIHRLGGSQQVATDRELTILEALIDAEVLDESARDYFRRMDPAEQPEREAWLYGRREWRKADREAHRAWDEWAKVHGRYPMPEHVQRMFRELESAHSSHSHERRR
jgi:hypothetical protein